MIGEERLQHVVVELPDVDVVAVHPAAQVRWEFAGEPTFDNQIATLHLTGRSAHLTIEKTRPEEWATPRLHQTLTRNIA